MSTVPTSDSTTKRCPLCHKESKCSGNSLIADNSVFCEEQTQRFLSAFKKVGVVGRDLCEIVKTLSSYGVTREKKRTSMTVNGRRVTRVFEDGSTDEVDLKDAFKKVMVHHDLPEWPASFRLEMDDLSRLFTDRKVPEIDRRPISTMTELLMFQCFD
ncbi:hypothetical protein GQ42DRAFT_154480 [Ramicandelaber brevisporus]|nr:hypothetical protein GQ42DRAFT_154480 [Ramicandelaber brevisporus]